MADVPDLPLDFGTPATDTSYLYTPTSAQPGGADFVAPQGYQAPVDTSYLYTPASAQPGGSEFVAPQGYSPTFSFAPAATQADLPAFGAIPTSTTGYSPYNVTNVPNIGGIPFPTPRPAELGGVDVTAGAAGGPAAAPAPTPTDTSKQPSALDSILGKLDLTKLLVGGAGGIMSYLAAQKAQQDAANARAEYQAAAANAASQISTLAQPYLTAGGSQLSMALQGALSPAQMQAYQAGQAQLAQQAARTGGIGAIQTAAAEQAIYQQALQAQQNMALQLLGPGNQLASNAIMTELQGTQGGLNLELQYGQMASQAMAGMMQSLGYGVGSQGQKAS